MTDEQEVYIEFFMNYRYGLDIWEDKLDASHTRHVELIKETTISKNLLHKVCISDDLRLFNFVAPKFRVEYYYDSSNHAINVRWYLNKHTPHAFKS